MKTILAVLMGVVVWSGVASAAGADLPDYMRGNWCWNSAGKGWNNTTKDFSGQNYNSYKSIKSFTSDECDEPSKGMVLNRFTREYHTGLCKFVSVSKPFTSPNVVKTGNRLPIYKIVEKCYNADETKPKIFTTYSFAIETGGELFLYEYSKKP